MAALAARAVGREPSGADKACEHCQQQLPEGSCFGHNTAKCHVCSEALHRCYRKPELFRVFYLLILPPGNRHPHPAPAPMPVYLAA